MISATGGCFLWKSVCISDTFRKGLTLLLTHLFNNALLNLSAIDYDSCNHHIFFVYVFVTKACTSRTSVGLFVEAVGGKLYES